MPVRIRKGTANDAAAWVELLKQAVGADYVAKEIYDPGWVAEQLTLGGETWLAESSGRLCGSISILLPVAPNNNPVANIGRRLAVAESYADGSAEALLSAVNEICGQRGKMAILRVPASDLPQQKLVEKLGYVCVGFQPIKHLCEVREGILFYVRIGESGRATRLPHSQSLPQINELASVVLRNLQIPNPDLVRDGATGYPLQTDLNIEESTVPAFELCKQRAQPANPPIEISGQFNRGRGIFRVAGTMPMRVLLGYRAGAIVAGLSYYFDDHDGCLRLVDGFATDDLSMGAMIQRAVKAGQELSALYLEVDFLVTAPRALKSAEQLGFVPVAYLPGFHARDGGCADLVKMVKLNLAYSPVTMPMTPSAQLMVDIIDRNFQDQRVGLGIINLLRALPIFEGLGDGELCKVARLFNQRLYRAGEKVFSKGPSGSEAYVVMRGHIDIYLEEAGQPIASFSNGAMIGEQAFLDGAVRNAIGIAAEPSILLVVQRPAFNALIQTEPHLGLVVMRNIALELSNKLRKANVALAHSR